MSESLRESWENQEELDELARLRRNNEIVRGVVSSVANLKMPVEEKEGEFVSKEVEVAIFQLESGVKAYCPATEFSSYQFRSLTGFVGTFQEFVIQEIDLNNRIAIVSVKEADNLKKDSFWNELKSLSEKDELDQNTYEGVISGFNPETERIFVRINGVNCFMLKYDWDHGRVRDISAHIDRGETIKVKVLRIDEERDLVQVSRKAAIDDPFDALEELQHMEAIAGKVSTVHPIHGIFVQLDVGLEVKGMKPRSLEEPIVGDVVSCRIRSIDKERRRCRVVITGYPRGKKRRKDIGSFLFE